jgi:hypothetical protein
MPKFSLPAVAGMANEAPMTNDERLDVQSVRHSDFVIDSSFGFRHSDLQSWHFNRIDQRTQQIIDLVAFDIGFGREYHPVPQRG